ncbi:MAG: Dabb family protein [Verrucomicrobiales bacterium]
MVTHTVFFWLNGELAPEDRAAFEVSLRSLLTIPNAQRGTTGKPAATPKREVIDDSYDYALELDFASIEDQNKYQAHPVHREFVESQQAKWQKVRVYDFEWL